MLSMWRLYQREYNLRLVDSVVGMSHNKLKKLSGCLNLHLFTMLNPYQYDLHPPPTPSSAALNTASEW